MARIRNRVAAAALAVGLVGGASGAEAADNFILCGGSPGGLWSLLGAGLDAVAKEIDPNAAVTYQTSSGGFANIVQVLQGKCDMGIVHVGEGVMALKGEAPFEEPTEGFATVAVLYDWAPMQWLVDESFAEEHGLQSIADLAEKKPPIDLIVNRRGILPSILAEAALGHAGVTFDDIESWGGSIQYQGSRSAGDVMKDGRADAWVNAMFIGTGAIRNIAETVELTLLSVPEDVVEKMGEAYGSIPYTVPADAYDWLDRDVATFGARAALVVSEDMDPAVVETFTTAMIDHLDKLQGVHGSMKGLTVDKMKSASNLPYHAGATAAYEAAAN